MRVRYHGRGRPVDEEALLKRTIEQGGRLLQVVSIIAKYVYADRANGGYDPQRIIVACIPNGALQLRYNPDPGDTIWRAVAMRRRLARISGFD